MPTKNLQISEIAQLLYAGNTAEAKRLTAQESERLEEQVTEFKEKLSAAEADLATIRSLMPPDGSQTSSKEAGSGATQERAPQGLTLAQKRRRENEILKAADEILQNKEEFTSGEIAEILLESGVTVGVPENRITTAIAGVLKRHKDKYTWVDRGVYAKRQDLSPQGANGGPIDLESRLSE